MQMKRRQYKEEYTPFTLYSSSALGVLDEEVENQAEAESQKTAKDAVVQGGEHDFAEALALGILVLDGDQGGDHERETERLSDGECRRTGENRRDEPVPDHAQNPTVEDGQGDDRDKEARECPAV